MKKSCPRNTRSTPMKQNLHDKAFVSFVCFVGKPLLANLCASWWEIAAPKNLRNTRRIWPIAVHAFSETALGKRGSASRTVVLLAGVYRSKRGRPPRNIHPLDIHYQHLQREMLATLQTIKIAA